MRILHHYDENNFLTVFFKLAKFGLLKRSESTNVQTDDLSSKIFTK